MTNQHDQGFSLIELLLVIVILGILGLVVAASVTGMSEKAEDSGCRSDAHILATSAEAYFAQRGTDVIPDAGGPDGYEKTLVADGFLRRPSDYFDLGADGQLVQVGPPCTV